MEANKEMFRCVGDIEADGLLHDATQIWCAVFKDIDTGKLYKFWPDDDGEYIYYLLGFMRLIDVLIMHNGVGYDLPLLKKLYDFEFKGEIVDTLLMSRLQRPNRTLPHGLEKKVGPHSVEAWGYRLGDKKVEIGEYEWKEWSPKILERCEQDVEIQHQIYEALLKEGEGENWEQAHKLTAKLFTNLKRQEDYGWLIDKEHLDNAILMLDRWIARIDRTTEHYLPLISEILEIKKGGEYGFVKKPFKKDGSYAENTVRYFDSFGDTGPHNDISTVAGCFSRVRFRHIDLDSSKETKQFLLDLGWQPAEWNKDSEGRHTSPKLSQDDPFDGIQGSLGRLITKRIQCKQRKGVIEGWRNAIRPDGRLPSKVTGLTVTGRARHSLIANIPRPSSFFGKAMRRCFIAKPGWVLVGTDSDANHYRTLAAWMGDREFKDAVVAGKSEDGTDMHSLNQKKIGIGTRTDAKIFFYALLLGAQPPRLAKVLSTSVKNAKALRERFMDSMPGLEKLIDKLTNVWRSNARQAYNAKWHKVEFKDGWFPGIDRRPVFCENENAILGYALQNAESTMMAAAYNVFHKWMDKKGYVWGEDYGTVCWYHDEFTVECKPEIANDVANLAERSIVWAGDFYGIDCPHVGNAKIGSNWGDIH
jgi:DNA polymerase I